MVGILRNRLFGAPGAAAPDYRPGHTLAQLQRDLAGIDCELTPAGPMRCDAPALAFDVHEQVQRHFLLHIVQCEFRFAIPGAALPRGTEIRAGHGGWLRRTGVALRSTGRFPADATLLSRLAEDAVLQRLLLPLDFTHLALRGSDDGTADVRLVHYGASEVVSRFPASRRYVRLSADQRHLLVGALARLQAVLAG